MAVVTPARNVREVVKKDMYTFITLVRYHPNMGPDDLKKYLNRKLLKFKGIRMNMFAVTFGPFDTVFVWQAEEMKHAKAFRDNPSTGIGHFTTLCSAKSDIW